MFLLPSSSVNRGERLSHRLFNRGKQLRILAVVSKIANRLLNLTGIDQLLMLDNKCSIIESDFRTCRRFFLVSWLLGLDPIHANEEDTSQAHDASPSTEQPCLHLKPPWRISYRLGSRCPLVAYDVAVRSRLHRGAIAGQRHHREVQTI